MKVLTIASHLSETELKNIVNSQKSIRDFKDWQIIYSVQINSGKKASEIANILGVTANKVYKTVQKYNKKGASWKENVKWGGRRERRCIMALEKEKEFLQSIEKEALNGQIITYFHVKSKLEATINRTVSNDYIWDMFKRHRWTKKCRVHRTRKPIRKHRRSIKKLSEHLAAKSLEFKDQDETICFSKNETVHDNVIGMYIEAFYYKTGMYGKNFIS
jgi:transposase